MTLVLHADPEHPEGGYAFMELPEGSLPQDAVQLSIMDSFSSRWLTPSDRPGAPVAIGDPNWQPEEHFFGPYPVYRHDGADWVRVGPEIVNKLDEYMPLKVAVEGTGYDVTWPDFLPPRAGAAGLGGLQPIRKDVPDPEPVSAQPAPPPPKPRDPPDPPVAQATAAHIEEARRGLGAGAIGLLLLVLVLVVAAVWWFWPDPGSDVTDTPPVKEETTVASAEACAARDLQGLAAFDAVHKQINRCGGKVSADLVLGLIEDFAASDDAAALLLFGKLYDGDQTEEPIETLIGLTFEADPTRAAEYYARAVAAGSTDSQPLLESVCTTLSEANSTLARGAYDDFCK
jgi:hypothetical protein